MGPLISSCETEETAVTECRKNETTGEYFLLDVCLFAGEEWELQVG